MESHTNATHVNNNGSHDRIFIRNNNESHSVRGMGQENQRFSQLPSWFVVQLTITASLGGCLFGYDMGAISGTLPQLTNTFQLDDRQKELSESLYILYRSLLRLVCWCWYSLLHTFSNPLIFSMHPPCSILAFLPQSGQSSLCRRCYWGLHRR